MVTSARTFWRVATGVAVLTALVLVLTLVAGRSLRPDARGAHEGPALAIALPPFALVNEQNKPFGLAELKGHAWIADFVFTSCTSVCPKLTRRMAEIQRRTEGLGDALHLVTLTVDPDNDTPARLAAYAKEAHADPRRWSFLTGSLATIEPVVLQGFKQAMGRREAPSGLITIFHGERFVLVDADGMIRGYYEADDAGIDKLLSDATLLARPRA
jgi:protein SCO1